MTNQHRFELYLRRRQVDQVRLMLGKIQDLPTRQQKTWMKQNGDFLNTAINQFIDQSNHTLSHIQLDDESLLLSRDIIEGLKESMNVVGEIVYRSQELEA